MTRPTARAAKNTATIQPKGNVDGWGRPIGLPSSPYNVKCVYEINTSKRFKDNAGDEFTPKTIIYYELPTQGAPKLGDTIVLNGDSQEIKMVRVDDPASVRGKPDVMLATQ